MKLRLVLTLVAGALIVLGIVTTRQMTSDTVVIPGAQSDMLPDVPEFQTDGLRIMGVDYLLSYLHQIGAVMHVHGVAGQ